MKRLKLFLSFGLGFLTVIAIGFVADATTERNDLRSVSALERRVRELELAAKHGQLGQKVVAPFRVVDRAGKDLFFVGNGYISIARSEDPTNGYALIGAGKDGGYFYALSLLSGQSVELKAASLDLRENSRIRVTLGKDPQQGNYRLKFLSGEGTVPAGIGVSSDTKAGLALIGDKVKIGVTSGGTGAVDVLNGKNLLARLTEGKRKGGVLLICNAGSCDPPMVSAGDEGGYGVVATGPLFYGQGPTGAPGSFLKGKSR